MVSRRLLLAFCLTCSIPAISQPPSSALMPMPRSVSLGQDKFKVNNSFDISCNAPATDEMVYTCVNDFYRALMRRTGVAMKNKTIVAGKAVQGPSLKIDIGKSAVFSIGSDESYSLNIKSNAIELESATSAGVVRGLATLQQLLLRDSSGPYFPSAQISDAPRFAWRGLMIDVARHFLPLEVLRRNIDAMYAVKMNVLHLHLTDDEGFRMESKQFPGLTGKGSEGLFYTQEEIKGLIRYAADRAIVIVPEFDMPGHTKSWFAAYPELASAPGPYQPGGRFDVDLSDPSKLNLAEVLASPTPTIDPTRETTYRFLEKFFKEMAALFPAPWIHIGADENNGAAWKNNKEIAAFMAARNYKTTSDLQAYFVERLHTIITKNKKQVIGWEEVFRPGIPKDMIVQKWIQESPLTKGHGSPEQINSAGNLVIVSEGFYLDLFLPAYIHYLNPIIPSAPSEKFLGGEAAIWTELADEGNMERRVWPRAAAVAERLWSPEEVVDVADMYNRLFAVSRQLDEAGLQHYSSYLRALRRLAGNDDYQALKTLMDILQPTRGYRNHFARFRNPAAMVNNRAALVNVADWVASDSETRLKFRKQVEDFLNSKSAITAAGIKADLNRWAENHEILVNKGLEHSAYREVAPHSQHLKTISLIGMEAVDNILAGKTFREDELADIKQKLKQASADHGITSLAIIPEIESLVNQKLVEEPKQFPFF